MTKSNKIKGTIILIFALIISVLAWYFWPRNFESIIQTDKDNINAFSSNVIITGIKKNIPYQSSYEFYAYNGDEEFNEIIEFLDSSTYYKDYRNLTPWFSNVFDIKEDKSVSINLTWGNSKDDYADFSFIDSNTVLITVGSNNKSNIYRVTNNETVNNIVNFILDKQ